jgi:hypothetical protein
MEWSWSRQASALVRKIRTIMLCLDFNDHYGVLVDQQGLMLSMGDAKWLLEKLQQHLSHSTLELETIGRRTVEESHPSMVDQFNYDYFTG